MDSIYYDKKIFADNLNRYMEMHGDSQVYISKLLNVSKSTVSAYCKQRSAALLKQEKTPLSGYGTTTM